MKVLITNLNLVSLAGTELISVDFVRYFVRRNHRVYVTAFNIGNPVKQLLLDAGASVAGIDEDEFFKDAGGEVDLVWGNHWPVVALALLERRMSFRNLVVASYSVVNQYEIASPLSEAADLVIFHSEVNRAIQGKSLSAAVQAKSLVNVNSLGPEWLTPVLERNHPPQVRRVAVVSNHLPEETMAAAGLLGTAGVKVEFFSSKLTPQHFTPELADSFDAVITIGHTVQKALSRETPVYLYDRFGGPGWIEAPALEELIADNFSARRIGRLKTPQLIAQEILSAPAAFRAENARRGARFVRAHCDLARNLDAILTRLDPHRPRRRLNPEEYVPLRLLAAGSMLTILGPRRAAAEQLQMSSGRPVFARKMRIELADGPPFEIRDIAIRKSLNGDYAEDIRHIAVHGQFLSSRFRAAGMVAVRDDGLSFDLRYGQPSPGAGSQFPAIALSGKCNFGGLIALREDTRMFKVKVLRMGDDGLTVATIHVLHV